LIVLLSDHASGAFFGYKEVLLVVEIIGRTGRSMVSDEDEFLVLFVGLGLIDVLVGSIRVLS
jgi:hypothetical protein